MARGINKVILIGNIGNDPKLTKLSNGDSIISLSLATTDYLDKTEWHKVILFSKLATALETFLQKGLKIYVEGTLRTSKWLDKNDIQHSTIEIIATNILLLGKTNEKIINTTKEKSSKKKETKVASHKEKKEIPDENYLNNNFTF